MDVFEDDTKNFDYNKQEIMLDKNGYTVTADNDKDVVSGEDASKLFERDTVNKDHSKWFF